MECCMERIPGRHSILCDLAFIDITVSKFLRHYAFLLTRKRYHVSVKLLDFSDKNLQRERESISAHPGYRLRLLRLFHERLRAIADKSRTSLRVDVWLQGQITELRVSSKLLMQSAFNFVFVKKFQFVSVLVSILFLLCQFSFLFCFCFGNNLRFHFSSSNACVVIQPQAVKQSHLSFSLPKSDKQFFQFIGPTGSEKYLTFMCRKTRN